MRTKTIIFLLVSVILFVVADPRAPIFQQDRTKGAVSDSVLTDSLPKSRKEMRRAARRAAAETQQHDSTTMQQEPDTTLMDSLELAIYKHNKAIDDSIALDSLNRSKKNTIDAPVEYQGDDSLVYVASSKTAYIYGNANVKYQNMDLQSAKIYMSLDSSVVHATPQADSTGVLTGKPVFKMGQDTYENDSMAFNFKSKKGLISNVYTQQEDGYLTSERAKRNDKGEMFIQHGRYTTCDKPHPDFYISLSRGKVRPGKDAIFGPAYLVVCDVPLPLAIPYGFFPFTKSYSSGFIMPTYGDESARGFYLRDGGYYFAISDTTNAISTAARSISVIRTRRTATRACPTSPSRRVSRYSGTTGRMPSRIRSAHSRPVSTLLRAVTSATTSPRCIIRRQ